MKKEVLEGNRLIAEFDGRINELCHHNNTSSPYDYDKSWDWLMPVVEKIESIIFNEDNSFNVTIGSGNYCVIQDSHGEVYDSVEDYKESKLLTTYSAVVDFIKWYNENFKQ